MTLLRTIRSFISSEKRQFPPATYIPQQDNSAALRGGISHLGLIAGNGPFPLRFAQEAKRHGCRITAVCHQDETDPAIESIADSVVWIRVGQLGKLISTFTGAGVTKAAMAGGINRIKHFGDVKLDARGAALLLKIRSTKDDVIMRGIADELLREGVEILPCTIFLQECIVRAGCLTKAQVTDEEQSDIDVGAEAIRVMGSQDIGQLVVVRKGVVVAVEAVEGTNAAILRGGELGGPGTVVVKYAKPTQDMRFDVPTVGVKTIETMVQVKARVLALEAGRSLIMEEDKVVALADANRIAIVGCAPLVSTPGSQEE